MTQQQDTVDLREQLANCIRQEVSDETILSAFQRVPRHEFIHGFYTRTKTTWRYISPSDPEWLSEIYTNRPLTISLDSHDNPNSSSSQPDLMALMLQSAQLDPHSRVLEIGTGTGYNAAILSTIVGNQNVVSIDINEHLTTMAQSRLDAIVGPGVTVLHGDGRILPETIGRFDVILVTGAHDRLESSWIQALSPGGRLVFNWAKSFIKVMIKAKKMNDGMVGWVSPYGGDFMSLHDGNGIRPSQLTPIPLRVVAPTDYRFLCEDLDFLFFSRSSFNWIFIAIVTAAMNMCM